MKFLCIEHVCCLLFVGKNEVDYWQVVNMDISIKGEVIRVTYYEGMEV
jgi:hypothetical protein